MQKRRYRLPVTVLCHLMVLLGAFMVLLGAVSVPARAAPPHAPTHIAAELLAGPVKDGKATLAIRMTPEAGWHGYWLNPGDAGLGMQLSWDVPEGVKTGQPRYPVPQTLVVQGLMNHVYESEYAVLVPVTVPAGKGRIPVHVKAQWLACTEQICVPERAELAAEIAAGAPHDPRFDTWTQRLPAPLDTPAAFALNDKTLRLAIPLPASVPLEAPHLFVGQDKLIDYAAPQAFARKGDMLLVTIPRARFAPQNAAGIDAVLRLDAAGNGITLTARPGPVPSGGTMLAGSEAPKLPALPWLLLAALAGGLLLNVMPCVFPILSLKALSLARAGESEAHARIEGLAYAAGVILACLGLGAALLALRAGGEQVGWAFQLQEPVVVVALFALAVAITANLLGLFEFSVPGFASAGSPQGAFATGLLAAFVATPCTGPFMASAMGAALLLPVVPAMALFATLGLGIALPFLAVAFVPALRARLPRPGKWMVTFRRVMAVPMGLTALALAWLIWRLGGSASLAYVAALAALVLALLGLVGRAQRSGKRALMPAFATLAVLAVGVLTMPEPRPQAQEETSIIKARPFSPEALAAARASGKPVFVWMTADWCLTCKVNEAAAIEREDTRVAFEKAGVVVLRGDWTRRDPAITRYLTEQGAAGVPLYVWYGRDGRAETLPQVLTPALLAEKAR
ncbi:protein-disulfide reductase DsbD family protein [Novosphingobium resinovorum]|uniref:protein-disulfide reductase DsbD family protein n=1 Tax=Novosphingobium TaxID=165696 RepID=UPI001B3C8B41|nr:MULTISPECIES: protein-disulfide reductase DsbD domain-containing protein [Novosphingobium]MBF7012654.1 thioredoxin family protein [Novosphingobium sp. HR1a]WJM27387.1 protein-disulfide reductase DsbD family protein [Novosphingobium resinovorum]